MFGSVSDSNNSSAHIWREQNISLRTKIPLVGAVLALDLNAGRHAFPFDLTETMAGYTVASSVASFSILQHLADNEMTMSAL